MAAIAPQVIPGAPGGAAALAAPATGFGPNTAAIAGLPAPPLAPVAVPVGNALAPPGAPTLAALGLTPATPGLAPAPAAGYAGGDAYTAAWQKLNLLNSATQNNNLISDKANEFREIVIGRLRQIFYRIRTLQMLAGGAGAASGALVEILNAINANGYTAAQATALEQLAADLQNLDLNQSMQSLVFEVNALAQGLGLTPAQMANVGNAPLDAGDTTGGVLSGGRKRKKRKKTRRKKGGFKFTRMANSKRSLRMSRRKSLSKPRKKRKKRNTHKKRRKKTKKRR